MSFTTVSQYLEMGQQLQQAGQILEAITCYKQTMELDLENAESYADLAQPLTELGQWDEAILAYEKAINLSPLAKYYQKLGETLHAQGNIDRAILAYFQAIKCHNEVEKENSSVDYLDSLYYNLGEALHRQGKYQEAIGYYRESLEINPQVATVHHHLGVALGSLSRWDEAIISYRQAIEIEPNNVYTHQQLGDALLTTCRWQEAEVCFREASKLFPDVIDFRHRWSQCESITSYQKAIELHSEDAKLYYNLAEAWIQLSRWDDAILACQKAIDLNPMPKYYQKLGESFHAADDIDQAIIAYIQAINLHNAHSNCGYQEKKEDYSLEALDNLYYNLAEALQRQGKYKQAIKYYRQSLEVNSQVATVHHHLGIALSSLDQWEEAIASYRQAIHLDQNFLHSYRYLGESLLNACQWQEAEACFREAIKIFPDSIHIRHGLWESLIYLGQREKILSFLQENSISESTPSMTLAEKVAGYIDDSQTDNLEVLKNRCQSESTYTFIELFQLTHSSLKFFDNAGLLLENFSEIVKNNNFWSKITKVFSYSPDMPSDDLGISEDQKNILKTGYIELFSPISGQKIRSNQSFIINIGSYIIFYRFVDQQQEFYLIVGSWPAIKIGLYFPGQDLIISLIDRQKSLFLFQYGQAEFENWVSYLKALVIKNYKSFKNYISNENPKQPTPLLASLGNIGHYFWNEVSAIQELYDSRELSKINHYIIGKYNYLDIRDIFPEIVWENPDTLFFEVSQPPDVVENFESCLKNNLFVFKLSSLAITEKLNSRLYHTCFNKCEQNFLQTVEKSKKHFPLIWITIRAHTRIWISQVDGIVNIIKELSKKYPNLGIIFDGQADAKPVMDQIIDLLDFQDNIYNGINCSIPETLVWVNAIDLFIAPYGAGLIFPCQIANKPGVVHANQNMSRKRPFCVHPRENCVLVYPVPTTVKPDHPVSDYDCDWQVIYQEVVKIIDHPKK